MKKKLTLVNLLHFYLPKNLPENDFDHDGNTRLGGNRLKIAYFCLPLFRIFEAHRGLNIRKGGKQKYHRDQKISGVFFAMSKKMPMLPFCTENGGNVVSAERFPPDLFRTINPCHGSIVRKIFHAASRRRSKKRK
jgi:hypothetical protein